MAEVNTQSDKESGGMEIEEYVLLITIQNS